MTVKPTTLREVFRSAERQHSHARRCLVDREQRATLDVVPVRFEGVYDGADDAVTEKILGSDLDDAGRRSSAGGEGCREVEVVRNDDELVLVCPRQDLDVRRVCRTDGGPVDRSRPGSVRRLRGRPPFRR